MRFANKQILLAKIETTRGVDASPGASDFMLTGPVDVSIDGQRIERMMVRSSISAPKETLVRRKITFSFRLDVVGSGTAGDAPYWGPLVEACAAKKTVNSGVSVVYTPVSDDADVKSVTIYYYRDGRVFKGVGCMGNFEVIANAGEYMQLAFELTGKLAGVQDASAPTVTMPSVQPVQVQTLDLKLGTWTGAVARNVSIQSGNDITDRADVNSSDGLHSSFVSARNPTWRSTVEAELEATHAFFGKFLDGSTMALEFTHGTTPGNVVKFEAPAATYSRPTINDESNIDMYAVGGQLLESTADDNWTLTVK